jgi:hypothetical protein
MRRIRFRRVGSSTDTSSGGGGGGGVTAVAAVAGETTVNASDPAIPVVGLANAGPGASNYPPTAAEIPSRLTLDAKGRVLAVQAIARPVASVAGTSGQIDVAGAATTPVVALAAAGAGAGAYPSAAGLRTSTITLDAQGRVSAIATSNTLALDGGVTTGRAAGANLTLNGGANTWTLLADAASLGSADRLLISGANPIALEATATGETLEVRRTNAAGGATIRSVWRTPSGASGSGATIGGITFAGWGSAAHPPFASGVLGAQILAVSEAAFTASSAPSSLRLYTSGAGSVAPTERLRIDQFGRTNLASDAAISSNRIDVLTVQRLNAPTSAPGAFDAMLRCSYAPAGAPPLSYTVTVPMLSFLMGTGGGTDGGGTTFIMSMIGGHGGGPPVAGTLSLQMTNGSFSVQEFMRIGPEGTLRFMDVNTGSAFQPNGTASTTLGSLGPAGTTTPKKWLRVQDNAGANLYIPCW